MKNKCAEKFYNVLFIDWNFKLFEFTEPEADTILPFFIEYKLTKAIKNIIPQIRRHPQ